MPKTHTLKTWPSYFEAVKSGLKRFELRKNDRDFAVGDVLQLREFDPGKEVTLADWKHTGREFSCVVTYIIHGGQWGIEQGHCVMGIDPLVEPAADCNCAMAPEHKTMPCPRHA